MNVGKILNKIIYSKQIVNKHSYRTVYKPLGITQDTFQASCLGLSSITNVRQGRYGSVCDGSKPLKSFMKLFPDKTFFEKNILKYGRSTNTNADAPSYLKAKTSIPLSTSGVHDCSVAYFVNQKDNTHFLFHIHPFMEESSIKKAIERFMPDGFQKAIIVPGDNYNTVTHRRTLPGLFETIKSINPKTSVEVFHNSSRYPEIVGYKGGVYEIPNKKYFLEFRSCGQATFEICDIQNDTIFNPIARAQSETELENLRKQFAQENYGIEIKKVINRLINEKIENIKMKVLNKN